MLTVQRYVGQEMLAFIDELARLRIEVFREFPYLYDGSMDYERNYLQTYAQAPEAMCAIAFDGDRPVGASTALPMDQEEPAFARPFAEQGYDVSKVFYFGESVLEKTYRGRGVGVRFFQEREGYARKLGRFDVAAFCAVDRPANHPRRPADYVPLDHFWQKRGFEKHPELRTEFEWKQIDEAEPSPKPLTFWLKPLR